MPLFVFVSGFFSKSMGDAGSVKRNKIVNIFVLYIVIQSVKCIISGSFSIIKPVYGNWYLLCLVVWYTSLPFLNNLKPLFVVISTVLFGLLIGIETSGMTVLQVSRMVCFYPFFVLGYYTKKEHISFFRDRYVIGIIVFLVSIFMLHILATKGFSHSILHANKCYSEMKYSMQQGVFYRLLWYFISTFMSCGVLCFVPSKRNCFTNIGKHTLPIYVLHTCLYLFLIKKTVLLNYFSNNLGIVELLIGDFCISLIVLVVFGNALFSKPFDKVLMYDFKALK